MALGMGELGWTPHDFWNSTLPELLAALRGRAEKERAEYWRTGGIIAAFYNVNRDTKKHGMLGAPDIYPFLLTQKEHEAREMAEIRRQFSSGLDEDED